MFLNHSDDNLFEIVDKLKKDGYEHTMTLNPSVFIKYVYDLIQEYKMQPNNLDNAIRVLESLSLLFEEDFIFPIREK